MGKNDGLENKENLKEIVIGFLRQGCTEDEIKKQFSIPLSDFHLNKDNQMKTIEDVFRANREMEAKSVMDVSFVIQENCVKDDVFKLFGQGWQKEEIANGLRITKAEIELFLEFHDYEERGE
jgi:uncharacterized protein (DUF433 family)